MSRVGHVHLNRYNSDACPDCSCAPAFSGINYSQLTGLPRGLRRERTASAQDRPGFQGVPYAGPCCPHLCLTRPAPACLGAQRMSASTRTPSTCQGPRWQCCALRACWSASGDTLGCHIKGYRHLAGGQQYIRSADGESRGVGNNRYQADKTRAIWSQGPDSARTLGQLMHLDPKWQGPTVCRSFHPMAP